jgi:hypothetical protein
VTIWGRRNTPKINNNQITAKNNFYPGFHIYPTQKYIERNPTQKNEENNKNYATRVMAII